jgi:hypothetical protein
MVSLTFLPVDGVGGLPYQFVAVDRVLDEILGFRAIRQERFDFTAKDVVAGARLDEKVSAFVDGAFERGVIQPLDL